MSDERDGEHSRTRGLQKRWAEEDAAREKRQQREKELFLEEQANEIFAPIDECLTRVDKVLRGFGASIDYDRTWKHLGDQRLRRSATVKSAQPDRELPLGFTIEGRRIFYRDECYQTSRETQALIRILVREIEHFLEPR
jgi:hypothetical protein